jgi:hypothetical protein
MLSRVIDMNMKVNNVNGRTFLAAAYTSASRPIRRRGTPHLLTKTQMEGAAFFHHV